MLPYNLPICLVLTNICKNYPVEFCSEQKIMERRNVVVTKLQTLFISRLTPWKDDAYALLTSSNFLRISTATGESSWVFTDRSISNLVLHKNSSSNGPGCSPDCLAKSWIGSCFIKPCKKTDCRSLICVNWINYLRT